MSRQHIVTNGGKPEANTGLELGPAAPRPLDGNVGRPHGIPMKNIHRIEAPRDTRFQAPDPEACETMIDVRAGVDEIDRLLVALIARRQGYMDAAARIKPSRDVVRDEVRINQVLANVKAEAERQSLSWAIAEPVWREMMERCIAHEFDVWDATRGSPSAAPG